jgi:hypothetical protein
MLHRMQPTEFAMPANRHRGPIAAHAVRTTAALLLLAASAAAMAADPLTSAVQAAYAPYRAALFHTNAKAQPESARALSELRTAWQALRARFGSSPPTPYAADAALPATLAEVAQVLDAADAQVRAGRLPEAHETLERVRDLLAELRRRNGVIVFSDHMNAYHEVMELVLHDGPALLKAEQGVLQLMSRVGVLDHLAARLLSQADEALRSQPGFAEGQAAVAASVAQLRQALLAGDTAAAARAIAALKQPYSRLFLRFG